eukprot:Tamp_16271.p1 GENE.Tamp_16271~~Tamp_16271.p1  ORF type:complete len:426 (+),score=62.62 Tamp_16271:103-1278(+)
MTGGIGTSQYTAPEVLRSQRYDHKVDVYSFGIILWEIHAKRLPYADMTAPQIAVAVATQDHRPPPPPNCPAPFWQLMQHCWQPAPAARPSFQEVMSTLEDMQFVLSLAPSARPATSPPDSAASGGTHQELSPGQAPARAPGRGQGGGGGAAGGGGGAFSKTLAASSEGAQKSRTHRVPSEYATIAAALVVCGEKDQIVLAPGHYKESIKLKQLVVEITGEGSMQGVLIEGVGGEPALTQTQGFLRLSKVMIKSSGSAAIVARGAMLVIEDCYVSGGRSGLEMEEGGDVTLRRSVVCRCRLHGLLVNGGGRVVVESCSIFENQHDGIVAHVAPTSLLINRSRVSFNGGVGVTLDEGAEGTIEDNDLRNNAKGAVYIGAASTGGVILGSNLTS